MEAAATLSPLLGLALVALVLGMRHGVDADHLAAIDAMTRCNAQARPALARRTGVWFSMGHGGVVMAVALAVAATAHAWNAPAWLEPFGAWTSIAMLVLLGVLNLVAWQRTAPGARVALTGWRSRLFDGALRACSRRAAMGVGVLFALSFDTVTQAALMAATGVAHHGLGAVALLAGAFAAGMIVTDGLNGWWVARLIQRPGAGSARASRVMCVAVSFVSLATAAIGAAAQLSGPVAGWAEANGEWIAGAIVAVMAASFGTGLLLARRDAAGAAA
ncbi:MAG TPA: nickel transporter [Burkholderiaceae bacterium]|jgi:high-affinity nickel-transport protein|nr:nickel transporter [Burkholderiaceae bacterium]